MSKRGKRSGLQQSHRAGEICATRAAVHPFVFLRHSDHGLAWVEAGQPEKGKPGPRRTEIDWDKVPMDKPYGEVVDWICKKTGLGERQAKARFKEHCQQQVGQNDTAKGGDEPF